MGEFTENTNTVYCCMRDCDWPAVISKLQGTGTPNRIDNKNLTCPESLETFETHSNLINAL